MSTKNGAKFMMQMVCDNLKELRQEKELTQEEVATILKVSRVVYNRYEKGQREIPLELLVELADFYGVSLDYIVGKEI